MCSSQRVWGPRPQYNGEVRKAWPWDVVENWEAEYIASSGCAIVEKVNIR
jgi:hypothetical protein